MQACPPEAWQTFMYPLQLLIGDMPLAALMGMSTVAQLQAMEDIETTPKASLTVPKTPVAPLGDKHQ